MRDASRNVVLLGLVSLLQDVSSEMLFSVLPFFIAATGGGALAVALVGGVGDLVAHAMKVPAGRWADRARRLKPLIAGGYAASALGKTGLAAFGTTPTLAVVFRSLERVGKGVRGPPRDALLAESVAESARGRGFGLHRAMDTAGAVVGVVLAFALAAWLGVGERGIVLASAAVGVLALAPLLLLVEPPSVAMARTVARAPLTPAFRRYLAVTVVFGLANATLLLFLLRSGDWFSGPWDLAGPILLYLLFNVVYAAASYPIGALGDRVGRRRVLAGGFALFAVAAAGFAVAGAWTWGAVAFAVLGVAYGAIEGPSRALVVDLVGREGKGYALGLQGTIAGVAALAGGVAAALLWDHVAAWAAFAWCAGWASVAVVVLVGRP